MKKLIFIHGFLLAGMVTPVLRADDPIQFSDLQYLGAFRVPNFSSPQGDQGTLNFSNGALGYNPGSPGSLFISCFGSADTIAEISIPTPGTGATIASLPTATLLQTCADPTTGATMPDITNGFRIGGMLVDNGKLITTKYAYYDASGEQTKAFFVKANTNLSQVNATGAYAVSAPNIGHVDGYMARIPAAWQTALKGPIFSGNNGISIISRTSYGPAAFAWDPALMTNPNTTVPSTPLLDYPSTHPTLGNYGDGPIDNTKIYFNGGGGYHGAVIPEGGRSMLFFGSVGLDPKGMCYGEGTNDVTLDRKSVPNESGVIYCYDPTDGSKGVHAYPYQYQVMAYDLNDLAAVAAGSKQPWDLKPYGVWPLTGKAGLDGKNNISGGGAVYDPVLKRIYFAAPGTDDVQAYSNLPVIYVWQVNTSSPPPPPPPPSCGGPIYSYNNPQPLPAPSGTVVNVSNMTQLSNAISNLKSNQTIMIAAGTYNLSDALYLPQTGISNWAIRGATGNRGDVIIKGAGMNGGVPYGFWMSNVSHGTIGDLTIDSVRSTGVMLNPNSNNITLHNLDIVDAGDQHVKSNPSNGYGTGNDGGIVEYCTLRFRTNEQGAGDTANYTNGVDVHGGSNWIVRYNLFQNFRQPTDIAGPAILFWNGAGLRGGNVVDGNTFINNDRDISFGLIQQTGGRDSTGGTIMNNMSYRPSNSGGDVSIGIMDAPNTQVFNNTVLVNGSYPNAVEYRFATTTGVKIQNNLLDAAITTRDGATGTVSSNVTNATASMFVNPATNDLHLKSTASNVIDKALTLATVPMDIDGQTRPIGSAYDYGADEYCSNSSSSPTNTPPTVVTAAAAVPNPVTAKTTALSVTASDDGGEPALTYTWSTVGTVPATVGFSVNGTNAAKNTTATFSKVGSYTLRVTIKDTANQTVTSNVTVTVNATLSSISVAPVSVSVQTGKTQSFTASGLDQFGNVITPQPTFSWQTSGGGTIDGNGLFRAGSTAGGPFTITATGGSVQGTATFTVSTNPPPAIPSGLVATAGDQQVQLKWNANTEPNLSGYIVYWSLSANGPFSPINSTPLANTQYTHNGLLNDVPYYYQVTAVDSQGISSAPSITAAATPTAAQGQNTPSGPISNSVFSVRPNPCTSDQRCNEITFSSGYEGGSVVVFAANGKKIHEANLPSTLSTQKLTSGVYLAIFRSAGSDSGKYGKGGTKIKFAVVR